MAKDIKYYTDEAYHRANSAARWTGGFALRKVFSLLTNANTTSIALTTKTLLGVGGGMGALSTAQVLSTYGLGALGVGLGTAVRFYLNDKEMKHQNHQLVNYYRHEFAAKLGKSKAELQDIDLETLAQFNPSIQEELDRNRKERNLKTVAWTMAAVISIAAVVGGIIALSAFAGVTLGFMGAVALSIGVGVPTHWASENLLETVGEKLTGLNKPTTIGHVNALQRDQGAGHVISQDRIMAVYVSASPDLQEMIQQDFGKPYHQLSLPRQQEAILRYGDSIGLSDVTLAINERRMTAKELVFRVHGDTSNAYPEPTLYDQVREQTQQVKQTLSQQRQKAAEKWDNFAQTVKHKKEAITERVTETGRGWVDKLGLTSQATQPEQGGWAERVTANNNMPKLVER